MNKRSALMLLAAAALTSTAAAQNTTFDTSVTWDQLASTAWYVSAFSPPAANVVTSTGSGNLNPTISLEIGKRYKFNAPFPGVHPYSIIASGAASPFLLLQDAGFGSLEGNGAVDWYDDGAGNLYFNFAQALSDQLFAAGVTPVYMCQIHSVMTGPIAFKSAGTHILWPSGAENFENSVIGTSVPSAFTSWSVVTGSANYTAVVSQSPVGHPGNTGLTNRWLTVTDTDGAGANRVYSPSVTLGAGTVGSYTFSANVDIQSMAAGVPNLIVGQNNNAPYANTAGLEFTDTGVNLIIVGTTDGGIGKAGASARQLLYNYVDAGGFGQNNWVSMGFTINYDTGNLSGTATGSNGVTTVNQTLAGLVLQGAALKNDFRFCVRNNAVGATSVISYDNVTFSGTTSPAAVQNWENFR